ncbi:MAG: nickel pincer cofactor biosynthesis protein LarB [Bacillota bacterium]
MQPEELKKLLKNVQQENIDLEDAFKKLKNLPFEDLGHTKVDHHRSLRNGYPEVIYCEGKLTSEIKEIAQKLIEKGSNVLATRAEPEVYDALLEVDEDFIYHQRARICSLTQNEIKKSTSQILVVTGGTTDIPVAEEAAVTADMLGSSVNRLYDVGVAGLHRLLGNRDQLEKANVIIVVAGMEGALPSVVSGLVDQPVIAVPTSVGYGANLDGLTAMLAMLNSCASGLGVVNIDNGFGAGYLASTIIKQIEQERG